MSKSGGKKIAIIYHASCPDGFGAAWAAWKKFGGRAEYHAISHKDKPVPFSGKEVYFLDIVYKPEAMRKVLKKAKKVVVIDHHVTAKASVDLADEHSYDMKHSGAFLAWQYFHPGKAMPKIIAHIEDEDLWKFKLADTEAVNARLELEKLDFKSFDRVVRGFERPAFRKNFIREGELLKTYRTQIVKRLVEENAMPGSFMGYRTLILNAARPFTSQAGNLLYKILPPIGVVWHERDGVVFVSLRSNGKVDVSKLALRWGGGGHKSAAGFHLPIGTKRPWTYKK